MTQPVEPPPPVFKMEVTTTAPAPPPPPPPPPAPEPVRVAEPPRAPRLDVGGSFGLNNPAGIFGLELDWRTPVQRLSLGFAVGNASWGWRFGPQLRLYPIGF